MYRVRILQNRYSGFITSASEECLICFLIQLKALGKRLVNRNYSTSLIMEKEHS
nr:MAG TPA: hypothetical protein [Crassvirales sp.]